MTHPDPESLALSALGDDVLDPDERAHVLACDECHAEVTSLRRVTDVARGVRTQSRPVPTAMSVSPEIPAPPRVWQAVAAELGLSPDLAAAPTAGLGGATLSYPGAASTHDRPVTRGRAVTHDRPVTRDRSATRHVPASGPSGAPPEASRRPGAPGVGARTTGPRRTGGRRRSVSALMVAAVAVIAATAGSVVTAWWLEPTDDRPDRQVLLAAPLTPVEGAPPASGDARVLGDGLPGGQGDGGPVLTVSVSGLPDVAGYHGVWLIDTDSGEMVSLGLLPGSTTDGTGTFAVPAGLDLSTFDLVDVSDEPLDGDPTHSGVSLLRGVLAAGATGP